MYRLVGMDHYRGTHPGLTELWMRGEVRALPDEAAAYMGGTFPGAVEPVKPAPAMAPTMDGPPVDRMVRSPRKRGS